MYLYLGGDTIVRDRSVVGIFDLDNTTYCRAAAVWLNTAGKENRVISLSDDIPRSAVVCEENGKTTVYICQPAPSTLLKRLSENRLTY